VSDQGEAPGAPQEAQPTSLGDILTSEEIMGPTRGQADDTSAADEALLRRPTITIRLRLTLAFAMIFSLCMIITLWSMYALSDIEDRIHFLEIADSYGSEVQEARRYEKNFLLYGTNLEDAIQHLDNAAALLEEDRRRVRKVAGDEILESMRRLEREYRSELEQLGGVRDEAVRKGVEAELRRSGGRMVELALEFRDKERDAIHEMLALAQRVPFLFLGVVLVLMVFIGGFLARQIISSLRRFTDYTERIGAGDFSPIAPARRYRDEFSQLAVALNRMVRELDRHQRILVESHKLRAIGTLVAGVAHELNNPLNNVMLTAAMADEDFLTLDDDEKRDMIRDIISETERSKTIVRNLLDFARESETRMEPLNLGRIVEEAAQLVANQVRMAGAQLKVTVPEDPPPVHGDRQMLCQVFVNLIINAVDIVPQHGRIEISVHPDREEGYVAVDVRDNGPGIPDHVLPQLFDPFFTTKPKGKGTGLGLSVSQGIVQKLGGYIRVATRFGEGSTFTVVLPVTRVPSEVSTHDHGHSQTATTPLAATQP